MPRLSDAEREQLPTRLPDWRLDGETLERQWKFKDFAAAWAFMTHVALLAEKADHHPDWSNSYNKVTVRLSTHDAGGLTGRDVELAEAIDRVG